MLSESSTDLMLFKFPMTIFSGKALAYCLENLSKTFLFVAITNKFLFPFLYCITSLKLATLSNFTTKSTPYFS